MQRKLTQRGKEWKGDWLRKRARIRKQKMQ